MNPAPTKPNEPSAPTNELSAEEILATKLMVWSLLPLGAGTNQAEFHRAARESAERLRSLVAENVALKKENAKLDADLSEEITNCDTRTKVIEDLCSVAGHNCGFEFEWSSQYGFAEAVRDVSEKWDQLRTQNEALREVIKTARDCLNDAPELNMKNYTEDEISMLNDFAVSVFNLLDAALDANPTRTP